jgi:hypothetical protein
MKLNETRRCRVPAAGFSFVELLVAIVLSASVLTLAAIAFGTLAGTRDTPIGSTQDITLSSGVLNNFYGFTNSVVSVEASPSFGEHARAEALRELFERDLRAANAVYALVRSGRSTVRPGTIAVGTNDMRLIVSPEEFRELVDPGSATFTDYVSAATNFANASIFILAPATNSASVRVLSIYEVDVVSALSPTGLYASVRRYQSNTITAYYHAFYDQTNTNTFRPIVAYFEKSLLSTGGTDVTNAFRVASNSPFYFLWWPDPGLRRLGGDAPAAFNTTARTVYSNMADKTSFFLVVPSFPSL